MNHLLAKLYVYDEIVINGPDLNTAKLAELIKAKEHSLWKNPAKVDETYKVHLRVSDNNNPLLVQDLAQIHGLAFVATDKDKLHEMVNLVKMARQERMEQTEQMGQLEQMVLKVYRV